MSTALAEYVRILGRGPGRARSLEYDEAFAAMQIMLRGDAAPEAVGALLMLMRMKGEVADEIAGFAAAAQATLPDMPSADLDWPCYAAGRTRGAPWLLLSARLVAQAGHRVLLHGWNGQDTRIRDGLATLGIPTVRGTAEAQAALDADGIAYMPLEDTLPGLFALLNLRDRLGLRSCVNTVCRMLNPSRARASVQGVFHPSYRALQADAAQRLGWQELSVIKGGGGEFERHPGKAIHAFGLRKGAAWAETLPASLADTRRLSETETAPEDLWTGAAQDDFAEAVVLSTAALALNTLGAASKPEDLWAARPQLQAA
jgi:anthranilate phosphoribosyltransferase